MKLNKCRAALGQAQVLEKTQVLSFFQSATPPDFPKCFTSKVLLRPSGVIFQHLQPPKITRQVLRQHRQKLRLNATYHLRAMIKTGELKSTEGPFSHTGFIASGERAKARLPFIALNISCVWKIRLKCTS